MTFGRGLTVTIPTRDDGTVGMTAEERQMCEDALLSMREAQPLPGEIVAFREEAAAKLRSAEYRERYAGKCVALAPGDLIIADDVLTLIHKLEVAGVPMEHVQFENYRPHIAPAILDVHSF